MGYLFHDGDAQILVDWHDPVSLDRLLKVGALDADRGARDEASEKRGTTNAIGQGRAPGLRQQTTRTGRLMIWKGNATRNFEALRLWQYTRNENKSVGGK
ncbi:hypothetical protein A1355_04340 [Methylomonas koyamae]|uniref:Uncharacterized protein n=1 Tax=Methylomonas koyamae TaxID=702114 RepID=A0A177NPV7_9GAMM|nr:hypothetical protein A1355_04340 [Methylomonas koyamae]